ncbi:DUF5712 family protein [Spirosoma sp. 48-14]|uniref:DUF5712 family protein n=2 Tax=unclassified Spirosoma TaxID=2621999 RepID=UPI0009650613|nr:DUF5712 family protein [Spirosoma sp. 48-14]OJW71137.1 MAG: hypothetical protein BGO59_27745 [Spirosoma sp. 48-14]
MITKVLPPTKNREINYDNKGSCERLVNYFEHEGKELDQEAFYFSQEDDGLTKEEVVRQIDGNVKGLKREDTKFVSMVISPSSDELAHIRDNSEDLKEYTRQVMDNYARHFKLKKGNDLEGKDLVWYGIVHKTRKYKWNDKGVREGDVRRGDQKSGIQTHVHIVVSTRDKEKKVTLNPRTSRARFNIVEFQRSSAELFQKQFKYEKQTHYHKDKPLKERTHIDQIRYFEKRINQLAEKYDLNEKTVTNLRNKALETGYSKELYQAMKEYTKRLNRGEGRKDELPEFENLRKADRQETRVFARNQVNQPIRTKSISFAVESVLKGANVNKDDDREILKDLSNRRRGSLEI